jgi:hypothetical protein
VLSDLGDVYRTAWDRGRYERAIDYSQPLGLRFHERDVQWIQERLAGSTGVPPASAPPAGDSK